MIMRSGSDRRRSINVQENWRSVELVAYWPTVAPNCQYVVLLRSHTGVARTLTPLAQAWIPCPPGSAVSTDPWSLLRATLIDSLRYRP